VAVKTKHMLEEPKPPRRHNPKATKEVVRARVDDILRIILDGAFGPQIRQYIAEQEAKGEYPWTIRPGSKPLGERMICRYISDANARMGQVLLTDREEAIKRHIGMRQNLYARSIAKGDERTALACARDMAELLGLYPAKRAEVTGANGAPLTAVATTVVAVADLSDAQRVARIEALVGIANARAQKQALTLDADAIDADGAALDAETDPDTEESREKAD
jgi:hypothetical protein